MSFSALGFAVVFFLCLGLALFRHPIFGLYAYLWDFYNHPSLHWWGDSLPDLRWSLLAALVTLIAIWLHPHITSRPSWAKNWGARFLIIFVLWLWLQSLWALNPYWHVGKTILYTKYLLLFYLIYQCLTDWEKFKEFCFIHVMGCFILGWDAYNAPPSFYVGGRLEGVGGPGGASSNTLAMHLSGGVALGGFLLFSVSGVKRWLILLAIPFILNAIVLTSSRGGFLGLAAAGVAAIYLCPPLYRKYVYLFGAAGIFLFALLAHDTFWDRIGTLFGGTTKRGVALGHEKDHGLEHRLTLIKGGWKMFLDYPFGAGFRGHHYLSPIEKYGMTGRLDDHTRQRAAHNTLLASLVEHGIVGGLFYLFMGFWVAINLVRLKRLDRLGLPDSLGFYRAGIGCGLVAYYVAGQTGNYLEAEVFIWLLGLLVLLSQYSYQSLEERDAVYSVVNEGQSVSMEGFPKW